MRTLTRRAALAAAAGLGAVAGGLGVALFTGGEPRLVRAASADRYGDSVICTGAITLSPRQQLDGVWLIDYRAGKLLGTAVDKTQGKLVGWAEVDLVSEFGVAPRQDVHFMMATGYISAGQSALYVAETVTGKFGVYTMGGTANGQGVVINRHDLTSFRRAADGPVPGQVGPLPVNPGLPPANPGAVAPVGGVAPAVPVPVNQPALPVGAAPAPPPGAPAVPPPVGTGAAVPTLPPAAMPAPALPGVPPPR